MFLKAELVNIKVELDSKISELEHLKSEDILVSVVSRDSKKNISKSRPKKEEAKSRSASLLLCNNNISAVSETSKNLKNQFQEIKNVTLIRSHNITIERSEELPIIALDASTVNKYQTTFIKKESYGFPICHAKNLKTELSPIKLFLMNIDEATKHASSCCIGHLAINKAEYIYKKKKCGSRYMQYDNLIVCEYHSDEPKWAFIRYMHERIASNPKASYYKNIKFSYISSEKIPSVKSFFPERSTVIIFEDLCVAFESIQN
ncbi:13073_t:CDS:2 [Cetraspora pellucida]|uniref:13073_t:CDS:1 n=1 Tax=Cetraspora pellucida TaxID=1433469 RepID=A0A9N9CJG0_9GLOM|nr:13073_t:CDS:2 [Cetraspora pellucida]